MKTIIYIIILISVSLSSSSCGKVPPPMPKEQMMNIMMDAHIAEALINGHHPATMKDSLQTRYMLQILDKWGTNEADFEAAIHHMHSDPDYMRSFYESLQDKVKNYAEEIDDSFEDKNRKLDALKDLK